MGWKRIGAHSYLYRSVRRGGRVRSEYIGCGELATLIDRLESGERLVREAEQKALQAEREQEQREQVAETEWFERVEALASAALAVAGFRRHNRGDWRRRRDGQA